MPRRRNAFTLVELLAVIAIIALLIGILLPALWKAREAAQATRSLAQLQQISLGLNNYAVDHLQLFPSNGHTGPTWMERISDYVSDANAFRSPKDQNINWTLDISDPSRRKTSYAINAWFSPDHPPHFGVKLDAVFNPSRTIIAAEITDEFEEDHFTPMFYGYDGTNAAQETAMGNVNPHAVQVTPEVYASVDPGEQVPPDMVDFSEDAGESWNATDFVAGNLAVKRYSGKMPYGFTDGHAAMHEFSETFSWPSYPTPGVERDWYNPKTRAK